MLAMYYVYGKISILRKRSVYAQWLSNERAITGGEGYRFTSLPKNPQMPTTLHTPQARRSPTPDRR